MARIGKRELASLGILSDADERPSKSTRHNIHARPATPPAQQPDELPPTTVAEVEAAPSKQLDAQPPATVAEAEAVPGEQLENAIARLKNAIAQVAPEEDPTQPSLRVCTVCADDLGEEECPSLGPCTHQADICRQCLSRWVAEQLNTPAWDQLACPSSECNVLLTQNDLQPHVTAEVLERWDRRALQAALKKVPGYFSCPSADCDHGHVHDDEGADNNIWRCQIPTCGARICTVHNVPFHTTETCAQYDERKANEDRSKAEIDTLATKAKLLRYSKTCPNLDCGVHIHKSSGCDHMTCAMCRHQFCWRCLAPYQGTQGIWRVGNSAHTRHCRHYRPPGNEKRGGEKGQS